MQILTFTVLFGNKTKRLGHANCAGKPFIG